MKRLGEIGEPTMEELEEQARNDKKEETQREFERQLHEEANLPLEKNVKYVVLVSYEEERYSGNSECPCIVEVEQIPPPLLAAFLKLNGKHLDQIRAHTTNIRGKRVMRGEFDAYNAMIHAMFCSPNMLLDALNYKEISGGDVINTDKADDFIVTLKPYLESGEPIEKIRTAETMDQLMPLPANTRVISYFY
jgi:hypothetical protein